MTNRLLKLIPIVLAVLVPVIGCGKGSLPTPISPTLPGAEFVLSGVITEDGSDDGIPLPGVELLLSAAAAADDMGPANRTATTDENGHFSVNVPAGAWNVALSKVGYIDRTIGLSVDGNATMNFSMAKLEATRAKAVRR